MVVPKTVNGITIQWLCRRHSTAYQSKLNVYAEHIQRHKHPKLNVYGEHIERRNHLNRMFMPKTLNGITIKVEWLCRRDSQRHNHPIVRPKTVKGITTKVEWLCRDTVNAITIQWLCRRHSMA
jgi:hypothetical protein